MKIFRYITVVACACFSFLTVNAQEQSPENTILTTQQAIDKFMSAPSLRNGSVGVSVMSIDSMKTIGESNALQSQITASTMKTVTSSVALNLLGKDFKFHTKVFVDGKINKNGKIEGDLIVKGGGDPTLDSRYMPQSPSFIESIVLKLKEMGIDEIKGNIIADESAYPMPYARATWMVDDLCYGYGASIHALNFADNTLKLNVEIDKDKFNCYTDQTQSYLKVQNHCNVIEAETDSISIDGIDMRLNVEDDILHLMGNIKAWKGKLTIANPSPDLLLRDSMEVALNNVGIKVKHKNVEQDEKGSTTLLLDYTSPELIEIVKSLLERSDNMYTECLLRAIAANSGKAPTAYNGVSIVKDFWKKRGLDVEGLFMSDGSGLSRTNKAPVSFFTHMLSVAYKELQSKGINFNELFPVAGTSGTVRSLTSKTPAAGKFALKSGSMNHVQCYVGYYPAQAPKYTVGVLVNSFTCPRSELQKMISEMLVGIDAALSVEKQ